MGSETLDSEIAKIQQEGMSALAGILVQNLEALKGLDFSGFIRDLQSRDYDASAPSLWQMERITNRLENVWEELCPHYVFGTRRAKVLNLGEVVIYEALAKTFGDQREDAAFIWESYITLMNGRLCVYNNNPIAISSALQCVPDDSLLYIRRGLPKVFRGGYVERNPESIKKAERYEYRKLAHAIVQRMGSVEKSKQILCILDTSVEAAVKAFEKSIDEAGYWAKVTDYLEGGATFGLFRVFIRKFDQYRLS